MKPMTRAQKIQPHWWRKSLIAIVFGLTLTYGIVAIFAWFGPGGIDAVMKVQFNMWLISLIWLPMLAFSFLFKTAARALIYMLSANAVIYLLFICLWYLQ